MMLPQVTPSVRLRRLEEGEELDLVQSDRRVEVKRIAVAPFGGNITTTIDERSDDLVLEGPLRRQFGHAATPGIGIWPVTAAAINPCRRSWSSRITSRILASRLSYPSAARSRRSAAAAWADLSASGIRNSLRSSSANWCLVPPYWAACN